MAQASRETATYVPIWNELQDIFLSKTARCRTEWIDSMLPLWKVEEFDSMIAS